MKPVASLAAAAAIAIGAAGPALAAPAAQGQAADMAAIKDQLNALKSDYDAKIGALEARLKAAEDRAAVAEAAAPPASSAAPPAGAASGEVILTDNSASEAAPKSSSPNAMNPGVSVVLNGNYVADSRDPAAQRIAGYALSDDGKSTRRGFSLDESEITLAANVDPFLLANLTISFGSDNQPSVEEAYIQSTALPGGLTVKAGRFFSAIGYLNERHAHNWTFIDMPLPYRALLGRQYGDDGVQVRWLAPTPFFLELGAEAYRGDRFPGGGNDKNRAGTQTAFVHTGGDFNSSSSWLAAASYIHTQAHDRVTDGLVGPDTFSGSDDLGIATLVYKWAPGGNPVNQNVVLSGEYFYGRQRGTFDTVAASRDPRGWYVQGVYQFTPHWSTGLRYAALDRIDVPAALRGTTFDPLGKSPSAVSGLLEYDTSEFGRFRAEFTHDTSDRRSNDELMFQYTVVYGPHGAHRY